ncbi:MAG: 50S ribosomal protein L18 [Candidatus Niyogibacteria bacterium]|nr:50S ribosomal protein L18 [Candidatus Niyogibacteria bacterium]
MTFNKGQKRIRRHKRVRALVSGTKEKPRFSVYRSNKHIFAQIIDDENGKTIVGVSDRALKSGKKAGTKTERAKSLGLELAEKARGAKVKKVVFDRGGYRYHGRVKAVAEGGREGGLEF